MKVSKKFATQKGFTLIELLIVIVIIVILAAAAFVALDPATRFKDSRDAQRYQDVTAIIDALKLQQIDNTSSTNAGQYVASVETGLDSGSYYMIGTDGTSATETCTDANGSSWVSGNAKDLTVTATEGYFASVPIAPTASGGTTWNAGETGYYIRKDSNGALFVGACDSENTTGIQVQR